MLTTRTDSPVSHARHAWKWPCLFALLGAVTVCQAQPASRPPQTTRVLEPSNTSHAMGVRVGHHGAYNSASLYWQSPAWWSHNLENGWGRLDLLGEVTATYWHARRGHPNSLWQLGFTPTLRWWPSSKPYYLEAGFGPTVNSHTKFADRRLSTALQFGSHLGAGYVFNARHQLGIRFSHFSNANIKQPNRGLNVAQLEYAVRF